MPRNRRDLVFFILGGFFLTNAIVAELIGGKLFSVPAWGLGFLGIDTLVLSIGVIPWPVVFLTTDLVNEYFGKSGVRKLTFLAVGMICYAFAILFLADMVPAWASSPVKDSEFHIVFVQSMWIIGGSITAFLLAQMMDVAIFLAVRERTGPRLLWLRATGSTAVSQLIDTIVILYIAFVIPGKLTYSQFWQVAIGNYSFKLMCAVVMTPLIYICHGVIDRFLAAAPSEPYPPNA